MYIYSIIYIASIYALNCTHHIYLYNSVLKATVAKWSQDAYALDDVIASSLLDSLYRYIHVWYKIVLYMILYDTSIAINRLYYSCVYLRIHAHIYTPLPKLYTVCMQVSMWIRR